jgi:hypothetical protein
VPYVCSAGVCFTLSAHVAKSRFHIAASGSKCTPEITSRAQHGREIYRSCGLAANLHSARSLAQTVHAARKRVFSLVYAAAAPAEKFRRELFELSPYVRRIPLRLINDI